MARKLEPMRLWSKWSPVYPAPLRGTDIGIDAKPDLRKENLGDEAIAEAKVGMARPAHCADRL